MGSKSSQIQSLSNISLQKLLLSYSPISDIHDDVLGTLKIYRKNQFDFHYVALSHKLIQRYWVQDCKNLIILAQNHNRMRSHGKSSLTKIKIQKILQTSNLWLKVFFCQISQANSLNQNLVPLKICMSYLTFTLKQYIAHNSQILFPQGQASKSKIPNYLSYIIACVLDAYQQLRTLHSIYPCLNILAMVSTITNLSLIYINVYGGIKFLPLPLFIFADNFSNLDQCIMNCCQFDHEDQKKWSANIHQETLTSTSTNQGIQKLDSNFLIKLKKMIKAIHTQSSTILQCKGSQDTSQIITTNLDNNKNVYQNQTSLPTYQKIYNHNIQQRKFKYQSFWELLENAKNIKEITQLVKSTVDMPQSLLFSNHNNNFLYILDKKQLHNSSNTNPLFTTNQNNHYINKLSKIKRQIQLKNKTIYNLNQHKANNDLSKINNYQVHNCSTYPPGNRQATQCQQSKDQSFSSNIKQKNSLKIIFQAGKKLPRYPPSKTSRTNKQYQQQNSLIDHL